MEQRAFVSRLGMIVLVSALGACAAGGPDRASPRDLSPRQLAQEQWDECATSPSLVLSEISEDGRLYYRERDASTPTTAFQRCIAFVAYRQVDAGERPAKDIVHRAYFTDQPPPARILSEIAGHAPPRKHEFLYESWVHFYLMIDATKRQRDVQLVWFNERDSWRRSSFKMGPTGKNYIGTWEVKSLFVGQGAPTGLWGVRLRIDGRDAGEYIFNVEIG